MNNVVNKEQWHLDKRVPIALISMFLVQTFTVAVFLVIWKTETDGRLALLEKVLEKITIASPEQERRIIVLEQVLIRVSTDISEIKNILRESSRVRNGELQ
jgi:hypothetical protein